MLAAILVTLFYVSEIYQSNRKSDQVEYLIDNPNMDDKKLPGDSMTERAVDNALSGKTPVDKQDLPEQQKPKSNDLQGGQLRSDVIIEGSANNEIKVNP